MPLTCISEDISLAEWWYYAPTDAAPLATKRSRRCSCGAPIKRGEECARFERARSPKNDMGERIYGEEVPLADIYLCERCFWLFLSFLELGFEGVSPAESMLDLIRDYAVLSAEHRGKGGANGTWGADESRF